MRRAFALAVLLVLLSGQSAAALSVTQTIPVGLKPFGVVKTPDGHLYVSNNGTNTISVVDPATADRYTVSPTITVGRGPGEIAIDPLANRAYVGNYDDQTTSVVDIAAGAVIATLSGGGLGVAVDPGLGRLYVAFVTKVLVFDTVTLQQIATIPAPATSSYFGIALDPARHLGYIGDLGGSTGGGGVVVFDLLTNTVLTTVDVGGRVRFALTTDPARGRVLVATDYFGSTFSVIDASTNAVVSTVPLPYEIPSHIAAYTADRVYVTENEQYGAADLADIDLATLTVTRHRIYGDAGAGGPRPAGLVLIGPKVYVALNGSNVLAVMDESAPVVSATVSPPAPKTNDTLTATVYASDPDGDPLTYTYQWTKNGSDIAGATTLTLDLSVSGNGDRGDSVAFRVTASDGTHTTTAQSRPIVVTDSAPVVDSVTVTPSSARTSDLLSVSSTGHDADGGDAVTFGYQWTRNGVDIAGATGSSLDLSVAGNGDRGDSVAVRVAASDGTLTSVPMSSAPVVIADTAPVATVAFNTTAPTTQTVLVATATASDADGEALTFTYVWKVNGVTRRTTVTGATSDSFDLGKPGNGNKDDLVTVELAASDGTLTAALASASATIGRGH
ncbi:MAG TPA: hypothetical protein VIN70_09000 [Candidatus Limnocylindria bacterium]